MRIVGLIPITNIAIDKYPVGLKTLLLVDFMRQGGGVPPIKVQPDGAGGYTIKDGRHRVLAHKLLGKQLILARFSNEPRRTVKRRPKDVGYVKIKGHSGKGSDGLDEQISPGNP